MATSKLPISWLPRDVPQWLRTSPIPAYGRCTDVGRGDMKDVVEVTRSSDCSGVSAVVLPRWVFFGHGFRGCGQPERLVYSRRPPLPGTSVSDRLHLHRRRRRRRNHNHHHHHERYHHDASSPFYTALQPNIFPVLIQGFRSGEWVGGNSRGSLVADRRRSGRRSIE